MVITFTVMSLVAAATVMADDEVVAPVIVDQPKSVNVMNLSNSSLRSLKTSLSICHHS